MNRLQAELFTRSGSAPNGGSLTGRLRRCDSRDDRYEGRSFDRGGRARGHAVDATYRRTKLADVSAETAALVGGALQNALPAIAQHFGRGLVGMRPPQFLLHREGSFFRPRRDDSEKPDAPGFVRQRLDRRVLTGAAPGDSSGYSGGSLTFYGLIDYRSDGRSIGLQVAGETGLVTLFFDDAMPSGSEHATTA